MAIAALVLGILAILTFFLLIGGLFGLIALILGIIAAGRARRGVARGRGMAITGAVLGLLGLIGAIAIIAIGASFINSHKDEINNLRSCLDDAGQDQAKVAQCQREFQGDVQN
jgi:hypothetical protein